MIQEIYIEDLDEHYSPPERPVLRVALVGDAVFLSIGKLTQTHEESTFKRETEMAVPASVLMNAISVLAAAQERDDIQRAVDGQPRPQGLTFRV